MVGADGTKEGGCSGVLISPHLVLTAGHCVCLERPLDAPGGEAMTVIDGAVCSKAVTVFTKTYGKTVSIEPHAGIRIEPHPGLSLLYRKGGILARGQSDLAIIHLEDPITNIIEGPGIHAYGGDSGGPCLRWPEGATEPVLVGITRGGGAPIYSVFTSTTIANHREWIERVIREAESLPGEGSR